MRCASSAITTPTTSASSRSSVRSWGPGRLAGRSSTRGAGAPTLPEFFKTEDDLRAIWSVPDTRKALLAGLSDKGFGAEALSEMQRVIDAENSDFVLDHYTKEGVGELDGDKLAPLLKLRYKNAISDAVADLGNPDQIRGLFIGFQRYLYEAGGGLAAS